MQTPRLSVDMLDASDWELVFSLSEAGEGVRVYKHDRSVLPDGWEDFEYDEKRAAYEVAWTAQAGGRAAAVEQRVAADEYYVRFLQRLRTSELEGERPPPGKERPAKADQKAEDEAAGCEDCA